MRLLFLGLSPPDALQKLLLASGFSVEVQPRGKKAPSKGFDVLAFRPATKTNLKELSRLRKAHPRAWIAVAIPLKWLHDADFHNALLSSNDKDEVWLEGVWEHTFWFSLQQFFRSRRLLETIDRNEKETQSLKADYRVLSHSSDKLIAQLERDVDLATNIQRSLLPKHSPQIPGVSIAVKYIPAAGLGGDYYDIFEFGDRHRFGVLMADSQTHGMAAALLSVLLKVRLEEMKDRFPDSASFVEFLNQQFQQSHQKDLSSLSLLYGILDRNSLSFRFTVAGTLRPILWRMGAPSPLSIAPNPPLGGMDHYAFRENTVSLKPGDLLILHTDGLEGPLSHPHPSAFERIVDILKGKEPSPDPLEVQNELMALVDRHVEREPLKDDLTLIHFAIDERALYVAQTS